MKGNPEVVFSLACVMFKPMTRSNSGSNVKQQLGNDLGLEQAALTVLRRGKKSASMLKTPTRELVEHIVLAEGHHIDWIEPSCITSKSWTARLPVPDLQEGLSGVLRK